MSARPGPVRSSRPNFHPSPQTGPRRHCPEYTGRNCNQCRESFQDTPEAFSQALTLLSAGHCSGFFKYTPNSRLNTPVDPVASVGSADLRHDGLDLGPTQKLSSDFARYLPLSSRGQRYSAGQCVSKDCFLPKSGENLCRTGKARRRLSPAQAMRS